MTISKEAGFTGLEKRFDTLLDQNQRIMQENELLRRELLQHPSGALQIRSVERSLGRAYRQIDSIESHGIVSRR
ncbi:hypothetical protein KK141_21375 [Dyella sp. LX-66]|uniref:hypothetical protein n=1 Tax=unclassified Dyella TaxID=2634549 RepID=UPI001BE0D554|nr:MULTISPECIES: hypothetical protein [unclassified Dyella]MBT2119685.1 hypothetical protein [Dyella sp. LX-1]MBT2142112.1 hypothetical protein [Dyella sp. LX-66]